MASQLEFLCVRCARQGKTCCQGREIYLSPEDVARIAAAAGHSLFFAWEQPQDRSYLDQDDDPVWQHHVFRSDGRRRTLNRTATGDCYFLGDTGCRLPLETRPLVCRLHPFAYTAAGIAAELEQGCPVTLLPPGATVLSALQMSIDQARGWHHSLYEEVSRDDADSGIDLRPSN